MVKFIFGRTRAGLLLPTLTVYILVFPLTAITDPGPSLHWRAGVAAVDITPAGPMWLAGYASRDHVAEGTLQPLFVKALALEDARQHRAVIITSDILGFPKVVADHICARLQDKLKLDRPDILLNSSHTHSGPVVAGSLACIYPVDEPGLVLIAQYTATLEDAVVTAATRAFDALRPARLSSGNGVTRFGVNRRNNKEADILSLTELKGPSDPAVPVLLAADADGTPFAILFGYACHATVLCDYQWCGDYPGFAQAALEKAHPGATALFMQGCGANINPLPRRSVALARQYGRELAAAVDRVLEDPMQPLEPTLATRFTEVALNLATPPTREQFEAMAKDGAGYVKKAVKVQLDELDAGRTLRDSYPYCVQLWRLGGQTLVALGGEVVVDYALAIKKMLGRDAFVPGYSNDVMAYIPSEQVLQEGGYEGDTSQLLYGMPAKWREGIEANILDSVRALATGAGLTPNAP